MFEPPPPPHATVYLVVPQKHRDLFAVAFTHLSFMMKITLMYAYFNILVHLDTNFRFVNLQNPQ